MWFVCKEGANPSDIIVNNVQYADRKHLLSALCSTGHGASTVASGQHRMLSVCGTATDIKHAFVRPFGRSQKLAVMYNIGGEYVEQAVI